MFRLIAVLVILGLVMYLVENYIPMSEPFRVILRVVVVILLILFLLSTFGILDVPLNIK